MGLSSMFHFKLQGNSLTHYFQLQIFQHSSSSFSNGGYCRSYSLILLYSPCIRWFENVDVLKNVNVNWWSIQKGITSILSIELLMFKSLFDRKRGWIKQVVRPNECRSQRYISSVAWWKQRSTKSLTRSMPGWMWGNDMLIKMEAT